MGWSAGDNPWRIWASSWLIFGSCAGGLGKSKGLFVEEAAFGAVPGWDSSFL